MVKVLIPLAEGFEDIEAITVVDVLRRGGVEVITASIRETLEVKSSGGVTMRADALFADAASDEFDAVILPGGGPGTENLRNSDAVIARLRRQKEEHRLICAICAAPLVLVDAGVLDEGQHVTCYPSCQMELDRPWVSQPVVVHGDVITGQAPGSALLFALVILKTLMGAVVEQRVARGMVSDVAV